MTDVNKKNADYAAGSEGVDPDTDLPAGAARADEAAASAPGERRPDEDPEERQDKLIDEGVEETFPASDPVSVKRIT